MVSGSNVPPPRPPRRRGSTNCSVASDTIQSKIVLDDEPDANLEQSIAGTAYVMAYMRATQITFAKDTDKSDNKIDSTQEADEISLPWKVNEDIYEECSSSYSNEENDNEIHFPNEDSVFASAYEKAFADALCSKDTPSRRLEPYQEPQLGNIQLSDDERCSICLDRPKEAGFVHGRSMHRAACVECAESILAAASPGKARCPLCNQEVDALVTAFF
eukprot:CAMPEP_0196579238 /NCGR_PEP_ID=MMETSP1081-20130531/19689_1 /TAXON_ID=36882 /ORGANISM="Pyramimonas amylifera, Strain CCMP720" /LENGTH=216 /DNA_ID=CAMNT_0041898755 /DNA_START=108 /DNA_END=758 /DNA_ORIENTATION=+